MENTVTPLVVAFTPNYFIPAATCLWSVLKHAAATSRFSVICLLTEELSSDLRSRLEKIDQTHRVDFSFINMKDRLQGVYVDERYTIAASYRLLLPEILPEYKQVIYLDCDMIIRNDLSALYRSIDLKDHYLGVVFESPLDFQAKNIKALGCTPGYYFNSGFLVMNLEQLRKDRMSEKFIDALKTDYLEFPDQDVLNRICQHKVVGMPPYYNSIRTFFLPQYKRFFLQKYSEADWHSVWTHGNIHYTGSKPWWSFTVMFHVWWQYYWELPEVVRGREPYNKKMNRLFRFYSTRTGRWLIETARLFYRRLK